MVTPVASYFPNGTAKVAAYVAVPVVGYVAVPVVGYFAAPVILGAIGFSATGPVAGSYAAAWQSSIGVVQAGSTFAALQSAAMTGGVSVAGGAVGAVASIAKAGEALWSWGRNATRSS
ncbi:hypothetical protein TWF106_010830 [Orbilia oligospora]|nr:hypothetical protein TWF788_006592 [Orbilia oligospora]KAF3210051.1 hypothetical protein TWF106_010830 [Orbilia oligospora]KAF3215184.1 hypothetical protein TWF679_004426 [Orbilia oligospora]KAF3236667.1 hypothetical protein TWF192_011360 [Orbilia oligospora]